ncbi:histone H2A.Z-specific chaperone CHZ1-like [Aristolochia californica]|uniref:histone H2A.Z-specific chaperone CHZ1-like n=1 Tax=Aristolochia californica TaxID=171875 RepID=UPI0035E19925
MSEVKEENPEDAHVNPKRKTDPESLTPDPKKHKPEYLNADLRKSVDEPNEVKEEEEERKIASNGKSAVDKGKAVVLEDKGKGKLPVRDADSSSSSDGVEDLEEDGEDNEVLDDPLAEVDLSNILPSRTRRRVADPGAYLVNDLDDDDDDDDDEDDEVEDEEDSGPDDSD